MALWGHPETMKTGPRRRQAVTAAALQRHRIFGVQSPRYATERESDGCGLAGDSYTHPSDVASFTPLIWLCYNRRDVFSRLGRQEGHPTRILGVDPGLNVTGYGVIDDSGGKLRLVEGGVVRTKASEALGQRLAAIHEGIASVISENGPDVVVVEELYSTYAHPKTAILMGHARGVAYLAASHSGLPVASYTATRVKKSLTGTGSASKQQLQRMVCQLLGLDEAPKPADVTDALALAICHARLSKPQWSVVSGQLSERVTQAARRSGRPHSLQF